MKKSIRSGDGNWTHPSGL